jgi:uncharacterized cupredoxin-like copper-binding protein
MRIFVSIIVSASMAVGPLLAQEGPAEKAKDVARDTAETAKNATSDTGRGVKTAFKDVTAAANGHRVNVTMTEYHFTIPASASAGKTTFVIKNVGRKEHTFAIKGQGVDQKLPTNLKSGETRTLIVDLKPGTYTITCPVDFHTMRGMKTTLTVR